MQVDPTSVVHVNVAKSYDDVAGETIIGKLKETFSKM